MTVEAESLKAAIREVLDAPEVPRDFKAGWERIEVVVYSATSAQRG